MGPCEVRWDVLLEPDLPDIQDLVYYPMDEKPLDFVAGALADLRAFPKDAC